MKGVVLEKVMVEGYRVKLISGVLRRNFSDILKPFSERTGRTGKPVDYSGFPEPHFLWWDNIAAPAQPSTAYEQDMPIALEADILAAVKWK